MPAFPARAGDTVTLGAPTAGLRTYIAVRGGIAGERGARVGRPGTPWPSSERRPCRPATCCRVGNAVADWPATDLAPVAAMATGPLELPLLLGPRDDWFTDEALDRLASDEFTVTSDADRVGIRLDGPDLPRLRCGELASEGVVLGALQVPTQRPAHAVPGGPTGDRRVSGHRSGAAVGREPGRASRARDAHPVPATPSGMRCNIDDKWTGVRWLPVTWSTGRSLQ